MSSVVSCSSETIPATSVGWQQAFGCVVGVLCMPVFLYFCSSVVLLCRAAFRIVAQAFLLLCVMSLDSIRVCHDLSRSSEMVFIGYPPALMIYSAKGLTSIYVCIVHMFQPTRALGKGCSFSYIHGGILLAALRTASTNWQ